jgi:hypothetical protein
MKKYFFAIFLLILCTRAESTTIPSSPPSQISLTTTVNPLQHFSALSIKEIQKLAGRKLKLKEKIAIKVFQWKIKNGFIHTKPEEGKDKGKTAMIFGIVALASLLIPIPYIGGLASLVSTVLALVLGYQAKKENPNDKNARTAIVLGWITVGLYVLAAAIVIAVLASL